MRTLSFIILCIGFILGWRQNSALAAQLPAAQLLAGELAEQQDLDKDGTADLAVIFFSSEDMRMKVEVFDQGNDMPWGTNWEEATDYSNDIWIFDTEGDGTAQLILEFRSEENQKTALVYDDQDGDGKVLYRLDGSFVSLQEIGSWRQKIVVKGDWLNPDGSLNLNLMVYYKDLAFENTTTEDSWNVEQEIVDENGDGIPEYNLIRYVNYTGYDGSGGAGIAWNEGRTRSSFPDDFFFWYYLSADPDQGNNSYTFDTSPIIDVNWKLGKSQRLGFRGYPVRIGYSVYSLTPWERGIVNRSNFESPQAYYDLAQDEDNEPELHVRLEYFPPYDEYLDAGWYGKALGDIRYSWNMDNTPGLDWDYKVGLIGSNKVETEVWIGDIGIRMVPYDDLPNWVMRQTWDWATFVAVENGRYVSSEGIYEWSASNAFQTDARDLSTVIPGSQSELRYYYFGVTDYLPKWAYQEIRPGLKGEYGTINGTPVLYFSPMDGKLHLRNAEWGVWNVDGWQRVRYANRDGDAYMDTWQVWEGREARTIWEVERGVAPGLKEELVQAGEYLVYAGEAGVRIKRTSVPQAEFEASPPRNHAEWEALGEQLRATRVEEALPPGYVPEVSLVDYLEKVEGQEVVILRGQMDGFRFMKDGFRFELRLEEGFSVSGEDVVGVQGLAAGEYVVRYGAEGFAVRALRAAKVRLAEGGLRLEEEAVALYPNLIRATLQNEGLQDAPGITVNLHVQDEEGGAQVLGSRGVDIWAEEESQLIFSWTPPSAGQWQVWLSTGDEENGFTQLGEAQVIQVMAAPEAKFETLLEGVGVNPTGWVMPGIGLAVVISAAILVAQAIRRFNRGDV